MDMGNFGFPNMIFSIPNHNSNSSEDSDSDTPYCYKENSDSDVSSPCFEDSETSSEDEVNATVDSVINAPEKKYHSCFKLSLNDIRNIEMTLDLSEHISLIFLLFDTTEMIEYALQKIRSMIAAGPENFSRDILSEWVLTRPKSWNFKLLEALAIIQNHKVLMDLGFCKEDISAMSHAPQNISRIKKVLFSSVCDYLRREQAEELIRRVRLEARFTNDITLNSDPMYIEFHLIFWMSQIYIDIEKEPYLNNLTNHLKVMGLLDIVHKINEEVVTGTSNTSKRSDRSKTSNMDDNEDCYKIIDPNNPGLLVIINNANFKRNIERRKEFQSKISMDLEDRLGSEKDEKNLIKTFRGLNYKVVVRNDIFHDEMVNIICDSVRSYFELGRHSVLVLCVLSHGDRGVVFGANSVPIRNKEIINSVSGLNDILAGIPKVIIIQACQGKNVLYVDPEPNLLVPDGAGPGSTAVADGDDLKLDGPGSCEPEAMKDKVVCMATIKGFVALRSYLNGTKYIQELCSCIKHYHAKKHFLDIMTKVHKNLSSEKCIVKNVDPNRPICMVPETKNTLCKSLYLTPKQATFRNRGAL